MFTQIVHNDELGPFVPQLNEGVNLLADILDRRVGVERERDLATGQKVIVVMWVKGASRATRMPQKRPSVTRRDASS